MGRADQQTAESPPDSKTPSEEQPKLQKAARVWSPQLAQRGWTPVPTAFFKFYDKLQVTATEAMFLLNIVNIKRDDSTAFPSYRLLGERLGCGERQARKIARNLVGKSLLTITERRRPQQRSDTNLFGVDPLIKRLEQLQQEAEAERKARAKATAKKNQESSGE